MLTIWCVYVGDKYPIAYVYNLKKMVAAHCGVPFQFKCITDRPNIPLVETARAKEGLPGWWQKLSLFEYADGPSVYFDIDSIIVGDIAALIPFTRNTLSMCKNWPQSGHGGWLSGMLAWNGNTRAPLDNFTYSAIDRYHGDQEFLTDAMGDDISEIPFGMMCSYKYHVLQDSAAFDNTVCVAFHGTPDYHEVEHLHPWISDAINGQRVAASA